MECGEILKFCHNDNFSEVLVISVSIKQVINGFMYSLYHLANEHELYVKSNSAISNPLNIKDHIILDVNEIKGEDYYIKINQKSALPV